MKRLGKLVIMQDAEYKALVYAEARTAELVCARDDAIAHADDFAEELSRAYANAALAEANRRKERKAAFTAGKFHAAGGYAHALKETRLRLQGTTAVMIRFMDLCAKWRPLVESLETYPNQFVEIGFDAGLHFPVKRWNKDGTEYLASVRYQDKQHPDHSQAIGKLGLLDKVLADISDLDAPADFLLVGEQVQQERRQP